MVWISAFGGKKYVKFIWLPTLSQYLTLSSGLFETPWLVACNYVLWNLFWSYMDISFETWVLKRSVFQHFISLDKVVKCIKHLSAEPNPELIWNCPRTKVSICANVFGIRTDGQNSPMGTQLASRLLSLIISCPNHLYQAISGLRKNALCDIVIPILPPLVRNSARKWFFTCINAAQFPGASNGRCLIALTERTLTSFRTPFSQTSINLSIWLFNLLPSFLIQLSACLYVCFY